MCTKRGNVRSALTSLHKCGRGGNAGLVNVLSCPSPCSSAVLLLFNYGRRVLAYLTPALFLTIFFVKCGVVVAGVISEKQTNVVLYFPFFFKFCCSVCVGLRCTPRFSVPYRCSTRWIACWSSSPCSGRIARYGCCDYHSGTGSGLGGLRHWGFRLSMCVEVCFMSLRVPHSKSRGVCSWERCNYGWESYECSRLCSCTVSRARGLFFCVCCARTHEWFGRFSFHQKQTAQTRTVSPRSRSPGGSPR